MANTEPNLYNQLINRRVVVDAMPCADCNGTAGLVWRTTRWMDVTVNDLPTYICESCGHVQYELVSLAICERAVEVAINQGEDTVDIDRKTWTVKTR